MFGGKFYVRNIICKKGKLDSVHEAGREGEGKRFAL